MCVIAVTPSKKHRPDLTTLRLCERANPDGSGVAWIQAGKVQWVKGLSAEAVQGLLGVVDGPAVVHFRIATVGGKRPELCHPFPVSPTSPLKQYGQAGTVLFHNGTWSDYHRFAEANAIDLEGPVSDSRVAAVAVYLKGRGLLKSIPCRFVLFNAKGASLFGDWSTVEGVRYSNLCWKPVMRGAQAPAAACDEEAELWAELEAEEAEAKRQKELERGQRLATAHFNHKPREKRAPKTHGVWRPSLVDQTLCLLND